MCWPYPVLLTRVQVQPSISQVSEGQYGDRELLTSLAFWTTLTLQVTVVPVYIERCLGPYVLLCQYGLSHILPSKNIVVLPIVQ